MVTQTRSRPQTQSLSLNELVNRFLEECRRVSPRSGRRLSPKTLVYYQMCLNGLLYFAAQNDWPEPQEITRDHLRDFMEYLGSEPHRWGGDGRRCTHQPASPATVHHYLKVAKTFFNWATDEAYLPSSPEILSLLRFRLPAPNYREVEPYTDEEVSAMLAVCEHDSKHRYCYLGVRNKAIISVFIDTGLRLTELASMKLTELDPRLQQVRVLGKGAKFRVVPLSGQAKKALSLYLTRYRKEGGDAVWLTDDGEPLSPYAIMTMIDRLKRRAGVRSGGGAHRFRHYFATRCLENGLDMNSLRLLLGHATLYMVLRYTKSVNVRHAIDRHAEYSPLDRLYNGGQKDSAERWGWRH